MGISVRFFQAASLVLAVVGCSPRQPTVIYTYEDATDSSVIASAENGGIQFALPVSQLVVAKQPSLSTDKRIASSSPTPSPDAIKVGTESFTANVVPKESGAVFRIVGKNDFWSSTQVEITRLPNSDIPTAVGISFTDQTQTRITQLGSIVAGTVSIASGLKLLGVQSTKCKSPVPLDDFVLRMPPADTDGDLMLPNQPCWTYSVAYTTNTPPGAIALSTFMGLAGASDHPAQPLHFFPVPACRDATITLRQKVPDAETVEATIRTRVGTPDYLYPIPLPAKGSIKLHAVCNADVTDTPVDQTGKTLDELNELLKQAKAIEDSAAAKKSNAPSQPSSSGKQPTQGGGG